VRNWVDIPNSRTIKEEKKSMAKKSRRVKSRGPARLSPTQMVQPTVGDAAPPTVIVPAQAAPQVVDLWEEYRYVIVDLKRIGIIAVAMLAVLIVLALLLT
jgi:hypothetical protein